VRRVTVLCVLALVCVGPARAAGFEPVPPVESHAYVIEDARTGAVLASSNAHAHVAIASITKLMTVLLTLERHKLTDVVTVDSRAADVGQEAMDLDPGQQITVHDLLEGALVQSANNAADALALSMAPSYPAFAALMNAKAGTTATSSVPMGWTRPASTRAPMTSRSSRGSSCATRLCGRRFARSR
jgi:serine-type D-Ala-D-Ala carboxypeptidase (penicillin-binding protein 5/6)